MILHDLWSPSSRYSVQDSALALYVETISPSSLMSWIWSSVVLDQASSFLKTRALGGLAGTPALELYT